MIKMESMRIERTEVAKMLKSEARRVHGNFRIISWYRYYEHYDSISKQPYIEFGVPPPL
jgi:hypothetical protein